MFLKKFKNKILFLFISLLVIPMNVFAYSSYIIAGGENIGIELNATGVIIVGSYKVGNLDPASDAGLMNGDKIISINNTPVSSIEEMLDVIDSSSNNLDEIDITYLRGSKTNETTLKMVKDTNDVYKTGLYVKDSINGVGTLTFIDPNTKLYGALGHEIIEKTTGQKLEIKDGKIYNSTVTSITRSSDGNPGEKNAKYDTTEIYGNVTENTSSGIFGEYSDAIPDKKLYKVASSSDIKLGEAKILTVINEEEVEEFTINILNVANDERTTKNILFEVTDKTLLEKTGGIVQGMSGSPIVQGDAIIGAVTHVVVDDPTKGYGIFITTMLEEAEN